MSSQRLTAARNTKKIVEAGVAIYGKICYPRQFFSLAQMRLGKRWKKMLKRNKY
jgi:hypothetical protein